jgi:hypothetical protein
MPVSRVSPSFLVFVSHVTLPKVYSAPDKYDVSRSGRWRCPGQVTFCHAGLIRFSLYKVLAFTHVAQVDFASGQYAVTLASRYQC